MKQTIIVATIFTLGVALGRWSPVPAQTDRLQGRWEGTVQSPQGERRVVALIKKDGDTYTGSITGIRGDLPFKEITVEGDKVLAVAEINSPQGVIPIRFSFTLKDDTMSGEGEVDFGGQSFSFVYDLKRTSEDPTPPPTAASSPSAQPSAQPRVVPQPQQRQSLEYFVGQWSFKWIGRESPLGPGGAREGTVTYRLTADGRVLEAQISGRSDEGTYQESATLTFDPERKILSVSERLMSGITLRSQGDWSSPIAIRFTVEPLTVKGHRLQMRRTISVISAFSFSVLDELSEDGGPFIRLGHAIFSKVSSGESKQ